MWSASVLPRTLCPVLEGPMGWSLTPDCFPDLLVAEGGERGQGGGRGEQLGCSQARTTGLHSAVLGLASCPLAHGSPQIVSSESSKCQQRCQRGRTGSLRCSLDLEAPTGRVGLAVPSSQSPAHRAPALISLSPVLSRMDSWQAGHPQLNCGPGWSSCSSTMQAI